MTLLAQLAEIWVDLRDNLSPQSMPGSAAMKISRRWIGWMAVCRDCARIMGIPLGKIRGMFGETTE